MIDWLFVILGVLDLGVLQGLVFAGLAFSAILSLLCLDFPDLSIEGTFPLGASIVAVSLTQGWAPGTSFIFAALAGAVGGIMTGTFHVRLGMSKLLSGICTAAIFYTINMWIMGNRGNIPVLDQRTYLSWFEELDVIFKKTFLPNYPVFLHIGTILGCFLIVVLLKIVVDFLLLSEFGVIMRGVGKNENAARYHGRNPGFYKIAGLGLANSCAALAGALAAQYQGFSDVNMGTGTLVLALVAVILGQEVFARLDWNLTSSSALTRAALFGVILHQIILAVVLRAGAPPTSLRLFTGLSLVLVIALRRRRGDVTFTW
jgi:putative tryptophan/tyrosine transport system permease protein